MTRYLASITDGNCNWGHDIFDTPTSREAAILCKEAASTPMGRRADMIVVTPADISVSEVMNYDFKTLNIVTEEDFDAATG